MLQLFLVLVLFTNATDGSKGILVPEPPCHLIHLVSGFLGIGFGKLHIDAVGSHHVLRRATAPESLHHKVYQGAQRDEDDQRKDILGLFEIDFNHGLSLFLRDLTICSSCP